MLKTTPGKEPSLLSATLNTFDNSEPPPASHSLSPNKPSLHQPPAATVTSCLCLRVWHLLHLPVHIQASFRAAGSGKPGTLPRAKVSMVFHTPTHLSPLSSSHALCAPGGVALGSLSVSLWDAHLHPRPRVSPLGASQATKTQPILSCPPCGDRISVEGIPPTSCQATCLGISFHSSLYVHQSISKSSVAR